MIKEFVQIEQHSLERPRIIAVGLDPHAGEQERTQAIGLLLSYFQCLEERASGPNGVEILCAGPRNQTYEEAFDLCQSTFFEVGWIYADSL